MERSSFAGSTQRQTARLPVYVRPFGGAAPTRLPLSLPQFLNFIGDTPSPRLGFEARTTCAVIQSRLMVPDRSDVGAFAYGPDQNGHA